MRNILGLFATLVIDIENAAGATELLIRKNEVVVKNDSKQTLKINIGNNDKAFLLGHYCLAIQRNFKKGELFPIVESLEIHSLTGKKTVYRNDWIRRVSDNSVAHPKESWAVLLDEEEGMVFGFFIIHADCLVTHHKIEKIL